MNKSQTGCLFGTRVNGSHRVGVWQPDSHHLCVSSNFIVNLVVDWIIGSVWTPLSPKVSSFPPRFHICPFWKNTRPSFLSSAPSVLSIVSLHMRIVWFSATPTTREKSTSTNATITATSKERATSVVIYATTNVATSAIVTATATDTRRIVFIVDRTYTSYSISPKTNPVEIWNF